MGFFFHQAAEKYSKGYLVLHGVNPPKIHDNSTLCALCAKINKEFEESLDECATLSKFYIGSRYPVHYEMYKKSDIVAARKVVQKIITLTEKDS